MKKEGITYTVQQVATMVGISKQLLRKWEDRYHIITPERLDNGYRVYSHSDVTALQQMKQLIDEGNSPKNAAEILKRLHESEQAEQLALFQTSTVQTSHPQATNLVQQLLRFGQGGDEANILKLLQQAQFSMSIEQLLDDVILPFLRQVGSYWETNIWGEYQEAMASLAVRDFLVSLRRTIAVSADAPLIVGSCLPGERHEIPMHILLIKCMMHGYQTLMLGPSPAPQAIESTVILKKPAVVLLTASTNEPFEQRLQDIRAIEAFAKITPDVKFYVGGAGAMNATVFDAITVTNDLNQILMRD
ncbi:MAG: MerR family transcriptional regulator [Solibacillus sp.]